MGQLPEKCSPAMNARGKSAIKSSGFSRQTDKRRRFSGTLLLLPLWKRDTQSGYGAPRGRRASKQLHPAGNRHIFLTAAPRLDRHHGVKVTHLLRCEKMGIRLNSRETAWYLSIRSTWSRRRRLDIPLGLVPKSRHHVSERPKTTRVGRRTIARLN